MATDFKLTFNKPMTTQKPNKEQLLKDIEALPICKVGKAKVTSLVETLIGEKLEEPRKIIVEPGATYRDSNGITFVLAKLGDSKWVLLGNPHFEGWSCNYSFSPQTTEEMAEYLKKATVFNFIGRATINYP